MSKVAVCLPTIGAKGIARRQRTGLLLFAVGLRLAVVPVVLGVERWWRLALLLPFWAAALYWFQARAKT